jgi:hypothetical protein
MEAVDIKPEYGIAASRELGINRQEVVRVLPDIEITGESAPLLRALPFYFRSRSQNIATNSKGCAEKLM